MIAAGSLFTSCVTNTEPQGIKDIREAKANYLDALANLRAADAEKVKAEATLVQAQAATEQARAALVQAAAKAKEIANDKAEADNAIALEKAKKDAEVYLAQQEKVLAEAEEALRAYLVKVEEQSKQLTWAEQQIVWAYTRAYNNVVNKQAEVREKEKELYAKTYNDYGEKSVEAAKAKYENQIAKAEERKAFFEAAIAAHEELTEAQIANYEEWVEKYDELQVELKGFQYDSAEIHKNIALNQLANEDALKTFYKEIVKKKNAIAVADAAGNKFTMDLSGKKVLDLPGLKVTGVNVVKNFAKHVNALTVPADQWITADDQKDTLGAYFTDPDVAEGVVDTLNIIIDALKREQVVVDQFVKDTAGIAALVVDTKNEYDSIKTVLEAGIGTFDVIAEKEKAANDALTAKNAALTKFKTDSTELFASISNFIKVWNQNANAQSLDHNDSLEVWNALIKLAKAREAIFDTPKNGKDCFYYCKASVDAFGDPVPDDTVAVKFSDLEFKNIRRNTNDKTIYGGYNNSGAFAQRDALQAILTQCGIVVGSKYSKVGSAVTLTTIDSTDFAGTYTAVGAYAYKNLFYNTYRVNSTGKLWLDGVGAYVPSAVTKADKDYTDAVAAITTAKQDFYKGIYCKFWGIDYDTFKTKLKDNYTAFNDPEDSLKIVYNEKTFTYPTVLPTFEPTTTTFFSPAKNKQPASIDFKNGVKCDTTEALKVIIDQLGKDYLKPEGGFTLYAQYLATAQFASDAKNYKDNTAALAELVKVVAAVETAYNDAVAAKNSAKALADSLVTKFIGKAKKDVKPADYVDENTKPIEEFISTDGKGTFNLAGEQKELAEKYLTDYAKTYSEIAKEGKEIDAKAENYRDLSKIYADYVADLAVIEGVAGNDPDAVYDAILNKFTWVNAMIQSWIEGCETAIALAEGSIKKLEAGYDQSQIDIENAEDKLAQAKQALEQAELEFAVAEEAYKAVLAAHGIAE